MNKTSDAQLRANKKWQQNNKEHMALIRARSAARSFVRNKANYDELTELSQLIEKRLLELNNNEK